MALANEETEALTFLLKAPSKSVVLGILREAFNYRNESVPDGVVASTAKSLGIEALDSIKLYRAVSLLLRKVLFEGLSDSSSIAEIFPSDFHADLRKLLSDIISKNLADWKAQLLHNQVSLPRLVDFDWRIDVKTSSDSVSRMAAPTCLLQMKVHPIATTNDKIPLNQSVNVEFSRETLETMLDGLSKIRDQLSSVTKMS